MRYPKFTFACVPATHIFIEIEADHEWDAIEKMQQLIDDKREDLIGDLHSLCYFDLCNEFDGVLFNTSSNGKRVYGCVPTVDVYKDIHADTREVAIEKMRAETSELLEAFRIDLIKNYGFQRFKEKHYLQPSFCDGTMDSWEFEDFLDYEEEAA